jgi:hypothetical protein
VTDKTEIIVHAWHVWESSGGFDWAVTSNARDVEILTNAHENAAAVYGATSSTLCTLKVTGYRDSETARQNITDFLEWGIQDAIEVGRLGHIISRFNNEPPEDEQ